MSLSFPFSGSLTLVVFVSWIPLLFVESYISLKNYRSGKVFIHAYLTFFIYNIGSTWWVWNADPLGASLAFILNSLLMTIVFYLFHLTKKYIGTKEGYISLIIYWIAFEYFHLNWEMSWTWLTLGNTFGNVPSWVQWYSYSGVHGGSLWVLILNLVIFRVYQNVHLKNESWRIQTPIIWLSAIVFSVPMILSIFMYLNTVDKGTEMEVVAIQPNVDPYFEKFESGTFKSQLEKIVRLANSKVTENTQLIVAPETAISASFFENDIHQLDFFHYLTDEKSKLNDAPWLIGASTMQLFSKKHSRASFPLSNQNGFIEHYNTSCLINENNDAGFIHKSKLVPGVEVIPFSEYLPFLEELSIKNGGTSGTLGIEKEPQIFKLKNFELAPVVCYESIYGEWVAKQCRKGAEIICIITNDGWWKDTPGYKQHLSFASLRAIENRKSIVRSANTGTSCFINQRGDISQATSWWTEDAIRGTIKRNNNMTFYTKYGNILGRSFSFVSVLLLLFTFVKRFKKKYASNL